MARKPRKWLCTGCDFASPEGVKDGEIQCRAAKAVVDAIPHTPYMRFESCPHRQKIQIGFLQQLAKRCREARSKLGSELTQAHLAEIEAKLRKEKGM